ncbi:MAG: hypothetical protein IKN33_03420 [Selenomonadaceae bacterium]|nr:hypothetical protein [Selenomonadaceae bacterium]
MTNKNVAGAAATAPATELEKGCQSSVSAPILPNLPPDVKVLQELKDRNVPNMDVVETVRAIFPGFDSPLLSKCRNHRQYGVGLREPAVKLLREHFKVTGQKGPRKPVRKKPHRIQCRVTDAVYEALQRRLERIGQNTQDYLESLILKDLKGECNEQVS